MERAMLRQCAGAIAGLAALVASGCAFAQATVKIGALLIDSGPLAGLKASQMKAIDLAVDQINAAGGAGGRKVEPVIITYAGTPDSAVDGATRAVQKDGALFITGMATSAVSPALSAKLASLNALMVEVYAQADALTGKACNPNYFRLNRNDTMLMNATGRFLKAKISSRGTSSRPIIPRDETQPTNSRSSSVRRVARLARCFSRLPEQPISARRFPSWPPTLPMACM